MNIKVEEKMKIKYLAGEFMAVTRKAAIAAYPWIGRGQKDRADCAGTEAMRAQLNQIGMDAVVVIGEGEMDEAPMLYIGEKLGTGNKVALADIAVDPVEGTTHVSKGQDNSMAVIAASERGALLHAPDMYMEKLAVGPKAKGFINIENSLLENMQAVAKALDKDISELTVMMQDRPRHKHLMLQVFQAGASVRLFSDVDITGVIATALDDYDIDILVGMGGAPEGVIAAAALKCLGGDFQGRLVPQNKLEEERCLKMGLSNPTAVLKIEDIVKSDDCVFAATGITNGPFLKGVQKKQNGKIATQSFVATPEYYQFVETIDKFS